MITEYHGKLNLEINHDCKLQTSPVLQNHNNNICVLSVNFLYQDSRGCLDAMGLGSITMVTGRENKHPHPEWSKSQVIQWKNKNMQDYSSILFLNIMFARIGQYQIQMSLQFLKCTGIFTKISTITNHMSSKHGT